MLPVYVICWRNFHIAKDCLESIIKTASEPLEITVVSPNDQLPNSGTDKIREFVKMEIDKGTIKRLLSFEENVFGFGLMQAIKDFPPKNKYFVLTDGDLIVPDIDWIKLSKEYHDKGWVVTGSNLSTENYKSPSWGFDKNEDNFGIWLQMIDTDWFLNHHGLERNCIDSGIMNLARHTGGATKVREIESFHCTWSIHDPDSKYRDDEYAAYKRMVSSNFVFDPKPQNMRYELYER